MNTIVMFAVIIALGVSGCATAPAHQSRPRYQPQERRVVTAQPAQQQRQLVMVPAPQPPQQMVVVQPQGTPTVAGGIIIPNAHDFGPGCRYAHDQFGQQIIICPQPMVLYGGQSHRGTPYQMSSGQCNNGFMPCQQQGGYMFDPLAVLGHAAGQAAAAAVVCGINPHCGQPVIRRPHRR